MINLMYVMGIVFEVLISVSFFDKMLTRKRNRGFVIVVWALSSILSDILVDSIPLVIRLMLSIGLALSVLYIMYNGSFMNKLIIVAFMNIACIVAELTANIILILIIGYSSDREFFVLGYVLTKIIYFLLTRIVILVNKNKNNIETQYKSFFSILVVPITSIVLLVSIYMMKPVKVFEVYDIIIYASAMIINYITVVQYDSLQRLMYLDIRNRILEKQSEYYVSQNIQMQELWDKIRNIRHNMKNEYVMNKVLLADGKYGELMKRYDDIISEIKEDKNIANSGNVYIDAIINHKAMEIQNVGGKINCKAAVPPDLNFNKEDMVLILGNMLDNVKDAFMEEGLENKECELVVIYDAPNFVILARNPYIGERKKNERNEYITTKSNKDIHGVGIVAIKRTVEKYKSYIIIKDENNMFEMRIIIEI